MSEGPNRFSRLAEELISSFRRVPLEDNGRTKRRPTQSLSTLVEELVVKHSIGQTSPEQVIRDNWPGIVGHANASYSHAALIDPRGRLVILAAHAVVRNELFLHRAKIVEKLQKLPGCGHIRELQLRAG